MHATCLCAWVGWKTVSDLQKSSKCSQLLSSIPPRPTPRLPHSFPLKQIFGIWKWPGPRVWHALFPFTLSILASRTHGHPGDIPVWPEMPASQSVHHPLPRGSGGFPWRLAPCTKLVSKWHLLLVISVPSAKVDPKLVDLPPWEWRTNVLLLEFLMALVFGESHAPERIYGVMLQTHMLILGNSRASGLSHFCSAYSYSDSFFCFVSCSCGWVYWWKKLISFKSFCKEMNDSRLLNDPKEDIAIFQRTSELGRWFLN